MQRVVGAHGDAEVSYYGDFADWLKFSVCTVDNASKPFVRRRTLIPVSLLEIPIN
jgi:hypothetical protein